MEYELVYPTRSEWVEENLIQTDSFRIMFLRDQKILYSLGKSVFQMKVYVNFTMCKFKGSDRLR